MFIDSPNSTRIMYIGGSVAILVGTVFRESISEKVKNDFQYHHHLGGGSEFGDIMGQLVPNIIYFAGQASAEKWWNTPYGYQRSALMFKSSFYAGMFTLLLKNIVQEKRPNGGDNYSFPSGHSTTAFAFASVVAAEHEWYWGAASYALATYVGVSRINDNAHYVHDVIAGAAIGTAFGVGLSELYGTKNFLEKKSTDSESSVRTFFIPTNNGALITSQWTF